MAKIAAELDQALRARAANGEPGAVRARLIAHGDGWTVEDVICTSGPHDRPFEELHARVSIAIVTAGSFQYRAAGTSPGRELMTPGSLLLGCMDQCFECGHEHATGDRCLSFGYAPAFFERVAAGAGARSRRAPGFNALRLPPVRALSPLVARACAAAVRPTDVAWDELIVELAAQTVRLVDDVTAEPATAPPGAEARVTRIVRRIEHEPEGTLTLASLASEAKLSPYHFLRMFERLTGVTPHQYVLRTRLRRAAVQLASLPAKILDIALDSGFGDVSNFNRAFKAEFGVSPRGYRASCRGAGRQSPA